MRSSIREGHGAPSRSNSASAKIDAAADSLRRLGVLVGTGYGLVRLDGVHVIPIGALGL
jgi:hypothetical protein